MSSLSIKLSYLEANSAIASSFNLLWNMTSNVGLFQPLLAAKVWNSNVYLATELIIHY